MAFYSSISAFSFPTSTNKTQQRATNGTVPARIITTHDEASLISTPSNDNMDAFTEKLKKVRRILRNEEDPLECSIMIDVLQHLAIDYHFQEEIKEILSNLYKRLMASTVGFSAADDGDLYNVSLWFRLLRQDGYPVPADVFNNFKGKDGKFKLSLIEDLRGMMGLYEASQLAIEGENILDEANAFAFMHLKSSLAHLEEDQARIIEDSLEYPIHKSLARFKAKNYIKTFESAYGANGVLQELAKLDFNIVQSLHQRELLQVSKWWRDIGLAQELKFARDQPVKWYVWSMATLTDPRFSEQRIELTKPISLVYLMDDIFDVHGTLDQLILFTEAINKWELSTETEQLPDYMKTFFKAIYNITDDISNKILKEHGWNPLNSLRKAWANLCNAFLVEAKWFASGHLPEAAEYLKNGVISSGVQVVFVHIFFLLGKGITKESVDLVDDIPGLMSCPATILRLWDDLGSAKDENQEGYDGSYLECYMKEHGISSDETVREHVVSMISNTWKVLNKECLLPNSFSPSFIKASLNAARMVRIMYSYDNNQRLPTLEEHVKSLLYESIPL